mmetsp:Transcript_780/g.829  ORF Transcript_780/g.829 Transcript_780/m.829 type:complete len:166 (+) Transcript_780:173-670(+)|eukprot:CAMPEP_0170566568 /NCGR_PEP_ID=MMETSP0211-20121228/79924_1 /TAXON_ID=311385 /ORGANISM="Pseudokeronopsis sp., Strain OXSARD2" /LENGTH=165 /DNA_ID=CAMNT_0010887787 /DNA_START=80 /DNA_END=577 /DNA_ORIENTATION=-
MSIEENDVVEALVPEQYYGPIEYKYLFDNPSYNKVLHRTSQMIFRLNEGKGKAFYVLGVQDDGYPTGLTDQQMEDTLSVFILKMASSLNIDLSPVWVKPGHKGFLIKIQIREKIPEQILSNIKIIMMGNSGVGKSTLLGVLLTGEEDDGDGCIRMLTVKHKYEIE